MSIVSAGGIQPYHRTFDGTLDMRSYEIAYEQANGHPAPGALPALGVFIPIILKAVLVIIAMIIIGLVVNNVLTMIVQKDSEVSITEVDPDDPDNPWWLICKGQTCEYFNTGTGASTPGPSNPSILSELLTPVIIIAAVGIGGYALIKIIGAMGKKGG